MPESKEWGFITPYNMRCVDRANVAVGAGKVLMSRAGANQEPYWGTIQTLPTGTLLGQMLMWIPDVGNPVVPAHWAVLPAASSPATGKFLRWGVDGYPVWETVSVSGSAHTMTSATHSAGVAMAFYSNASGQVKEFALGVTNSLFVSSGTGGATPPSFLTFDDLMMTVPGYAIDPGNTPPYGTWPRILTEVVTPSGFATPTRTLEWKSVIDLSAGIANIVDTEILMLKKSGGTSLADPPQYNVRPSGVPLANLIAIRGTPNVAVGDFLYWAANPAGDNPAVAGWTRLASGTGYMKGTGGGAPTWDTNVVTAAGTLGSGNIIVGAGAKAVSESIAASTLVTTGTHTTGILYFAATSNGVTARSFGSALQYLRMDSAGTALEWETFPSIPSAPDLTIYSLINGTRAFTGVVSGVTPTATAHLATKGYVDGFVKCSDATTAAGLLSVFQDSNGKVIQVATSGITNQPIDIDMVLWCSATTDTARLGKLVKWGTAADGDNQAVNTKIDPVKVVLATTTLTVGTIPVAIAPPADGGTNIVNSAIGDSTLVATDIVQIASPAAGNILYYAAGAWTKLAIGSANQVLTVSSSTTLPVWSTPAGLPASPSVGEVAFCTTAGSWGKVLLPTNKPFYFNGTTIVQVASWGADYLLVGGGSGVPKALAPPAGASGSLYYSTTFGAGSRIYWG